MSSRPRPNKIRWHIVNACCKTLRACARCWISLRKRPVDPERIEQTVSKIVRELESLGETDVSSEAIGEIVMEHLRGLDDVAYVRFASVYRNFREAMFFEAVLGEWSGDEEPRPAPRK